MADTTALKNRIRAAIKANDNQEITGPVLQQSLLDIVDELNEATETEASQRQSGDNTLQQNLNTETQQRQSGDSTLQQNLNTETQQRQSADTQLNNLITGIKNNIDNGYVYAGIATPSINPVSGKVFYVALQAGTYTNFDGQVLTQGINILCYNGSAWSNQQFIGIDETPTQFSPNLAGSGGTYNKIQKIKTELDGKIYGIIANKFRNNTNGGISTLNGKATNIELIDVVEGLTYTLVAGSNMFAYVYAFNNDVFLGTVATNISSVTASYIKERFSSATKWAFYISTGSTAISQDTVNNWYIETNGGIKENIEKLNTLIAAEITARQQGDTQLNNQITSIKNNVENIDGKIYGIIANKFRNNTNGEISTLNGKATNIELIKLQDGATYVLNADGNQFAWVYAFNENTYLGGIAVNDSSFSTTRLKTSYPSATHFAYYINAGTSALDQDVVSGWYVAGDFGISTRLDKAEADILSIQENVSGENILHLDLTANGISYVLSELNETENIKTEFIVNRKIAFGGWGNPNFDYDSVKIVNKSTSQETEVHAVKDEISPIIINGKYIGGNHGDSDLQLVTCNSHGKTYSDIGSIWSDGTHHFTIMGIASSDKLYLLGDNYEAYPLAKFYLAGVGTYTHISGATHTDSFSVTSVEATQLRPALKVTNKKVYANDKELTESGDYHFDVLKICENYNIYNPASILNVIQTKVGTFTDNPDIESLTGVDVMVRISLVYSFYNAAKWCISNTVTALQNCSFGYYGFTQQAPIKGNRYMYIPKLLPVTIGGNSVDFRTIVSYDSLANDVTAPANKWENQELPPDRWLQFSDKIGLESGYLFGYGVGGTHRKDSTSDALWLYASSLKCYPYGINNSKVSLNEGDSYSAVVYRRYFDANKVNNNGVIAYNTFEYNNKLYIYADFNAVGNYELDIPSKYLGGNIEVFEKSSNVSLLEEVSSSKMLVKVTTSSPLYGYLVASIAK